MEFQGRSGDIRLFAALAPVLLSGCAWGTDRWRDARDVFHFDASLGPQVGLTFRVTHILQAGAFSEGSLSGEGPEDAWYDTGHVAWNGRWMGIYKRVGWEGGLGPESVAPRWYRSRYDAEYPEEYVRQPRMPDEIGFSVGVLLIGGEVGFRPVELLDFLLGFFGADIKSDDGRRSPFKDAENWIEEQERPPEEGFPPAR